MQLDIDRVIKHYLDALDARGYDDAELCAELGELYVAAGHPRIAVSFAALATNRSPRAAEAVRQFNAPGDIPAPGLTPADDLTPTAGTQGVLCTAANARYFPMLLNMIGSAQHNSWRSIHKIIVCDIGLFPQQVAFLSRLDRVELIRSTRPSAFFAWKYPFILDTLYEEPGPLLYLDAGCYVDRDLEDIFRIIERSGHLFFYNGPYDEPKNMTRNWTSHYVYDYFAVNKDRDETHGAMGGVLGVASGARDFMEGLVSHTNLFLLRPHSDCIINGCDQSLFSIFVQQVQQMPLTRFDSYLRNMVGHGTTDSYITIHRSLFHAGEAFAYLRGDSSGVSDYARVSDH